MSALFILSFILENTAVATEGYFLEIAVAVIGGLLFIIGGFIKVLYARNEKTSDQVDQNKTDIASNKADIGLNKQNDKNTLDRFVDYQKQRGEKDDSLQRTLDGINESLSGLNKATGALAVQVGKLEEKIK